MRRFSMTVGELRDVLEGCDDDAPVLMLTRGGRAVKLWPAGVRPTVVRASGCGLWAILYEPPQERKHPATIALVVIS